LISKLIKRNGLTKELIADIISKDYDEECHLIKALFTLRAELVEHNIKLKDIEDYTHKVPKKSYNSDKKHTGVILGGKVLFANSYFKEGD